VKPLTALFCVLLVSACAGSAQAPRSPGPAGSAPSVGASTLQHLVFGGRDRTYRIYRPASLAANRPTPLVMVLHGRGGTGLGAENKTGFDHEADARGLLIVYPVGVGQSWNAGGCCLPASASSSGIDDVGFLNAVLDRVEAGYPIAADHVYVTGLSNGGMMAYRLACEDATRFAAIAPVAGSLLVAGCSPSRPVSVIHIHGTADTTVPPQGGTGPAGKVNNPSALQTLQRFAGYDGCAASPAVTTQGAVSEHDWKPCRASTEVAYYLLNGVGHRWPDQAGDPINATKQIADFFAAHPQR
jgi:polyhydroxybutyrate depolymerase